MSDNDNLPIRFASIKNKRVNLGTVQRYLPENYKAIGGPNGILIFGNDSAGWTLDDYVIPRLASGLIVAKEVKP